MRANENTDEQKISSSYFKVIRINSILKSSRNNARRIGMIWYRTVKRTSADRTYSLPGIETDCSYQVKLSVGPMDVMVKGTKWDVLPMRDV